jgi:membrane protein
MLSLFQHVLRWKAATDAVYFALDDYFPDQFGEFLHRNLRFVVTFQGPFQLGSILLLLFTANGIFEPLEVGLNRIWNCPQNRSYFKNQLVSLALIFACGGLVMMSTTLTALDNEYLGKSTGWSPWVVRFLSVAVFKLAALPLSIVMLQLIYWVLPNCKVSARQVFPGALVVGLLLEGLKYVNLLTWPYLRAKLAPEYGPFFYSVAIVLWGFVAAMVILAGAEWTARRSSSSATSIRSST